MADDLFYWTIGGKFIVDDEGYLIKCKQCPCGSSSSSSSYNDSICDMLPESIDVEVSGSKYVFTKATENNVYKGYVCHLNGDVIEVGYGRIDPYSLEESFDDFVYLICTLDGAIILPDSYGHHGCINGYGEGCEYAPANYEIKNWPFGFVYK